LAFSRGRLATNLPLLPPRLQLPIPVGVDLLRSPGEHFLRRDVADRTVQADVVVMLDVALDAALLPATMAFPAGCTLL